MAALDAQTRQLMQDDLLNVWAVGEQKKTVIYITHSIYESVYLADRILVMSARTGLIKADIENDFDRPRNELRAMPAYAEQINRIWSLIKNDAIQAMTK